MRVVVVIPTYNEKENIEKLLRKLLKLTSKLTKYEFAILVVDDNSPDGTGEIVKSMGKKNKNIHLFSGEKKGLGVAMKRGYLHAIKKLNADVVVATEADVPVDLKYIAYMLEKIDEGFDVVLASRHVGVGETKGWTWQRTVNHWVANTLFARWIAGVSQVHDHNGMYRTIRVKGVLDSVQLSSFSVKGFAFFFFFIYKLTKVTDKIHEFPATYTFRTKGESKVSFNPKYIRTYLRDVVEYVFVALKIRLGVV